MFVNRFTNPAKARNAAVLRSVEITVAPGLMNARSFHDDEPGTATCTGLMVGHKPGVGLQIAIKQAGHVPGRKDPVTEGRRANVERGKQIGERSHECSLSLMRAAWWRVSG